MSNFTFRSFANLMAYIAVVLVGTALLIQSVLKGNQIAQAFKMVADAIAYVMLAITSFSYAKSRRNVVFILIWLVAVVLIVVSYII